MKFYSGPIPGDERPLGGGSHNQVSLGHELYNFRATGGHLYGYFQASKFSYTVALERIDPLADESIYLDHVLVIFVARRPDGGGQFIVGWYRDARVFREHVRHSPGKPRKFGHYCTAVASKCVLLPESKRRHEIFAGKGKMGQANVCYPLTMSRAPKGGRWIQEAMDYIADYRDVNMLVKPEAAAEEDMVSLVEESIASSKGQGFARTAEQRRLLEDHSMTVAKRHFAKLGFEVEDVSQTRPFDLLCRRGRASLHVEVKGTTTAGSAVMLTTNEVKHARNPNNKCALFILHSIRLGKSKATGGKPLLLNPWKIQAAHLSPISFFYRVNA
jgi:hypothetical protein